MIVISISIDLNLPKTDFYYYACMIIQDCYKQLVYSW